MALLSRFISPFQLARARFFLWALLIFLSPQLWANDCGEDLLRAELAAVGGLRPLLDDHSPLHVAFNADSPVIEIERRGDAQVRGFFPEYDGANDFKQRFRLGPSMSSTGTYVPALAESLGRPLAEKSRARMFDGNGVVELDHRLFGLQARRRGIELAVLTREGQRVQAQLLPLALEVPLVSPRAPWPRLAFGVRQVIRTPDLPVYRKSGIKYVIVLTDGSVLTLSAASF